MTTGRTNHRATLALGFGLAGAIATLAIVADSGPLGNLLVLAPLLAAALSPEVRYSTILAVFALVLAVVLGFANDLWDGGGHYYRLATVGLGGAIAVWIARLRANSEDDSLRLAIQFRVARTLSESETLEGAAPRLLETIGRPLGWEVGAIWDSPTPRVLRCVSSWYGPGVDPAGFDKLNRRLPLRADVGLPGQVWESGEPVCEPDVARRRGSPREERAASVGLRGAVGFPLRTAAGVMGVVEFFAREVKEPEPRLVEMMAAVGNQIGEFIEVQRAAEALAASEARKGAMLESALDCVITMDHEGRIVEFNPAAELVFGYSRDDALGKEMATLIIPPGLRERHREGLKRAVAGGESKIIGRRVEFTGMRAGGGEFPAELAISRIGGHDPPMFTGYVRDITERTAAEQERERLLKLEHLAREDADRARDQLAAILRGVDDAVTAQAPDGSLMFANDVAVERLGYASMQELLEAPVAEVRGRFEVFDEEGHPFPMERLPGLLAMRGEEAPEVTVRVLNPRTREERWNVLKSTPIMGESGRPVMVINVMEDVTELKQTERAQRFLAEAGRLLASSLDPDELLQRVADHAVSEIADWCAVHIPEGERIKLAAVASSEPDKVELVRAMDRRYPAMSSAETGAAAVLRNRESQLIPEVSDELLVESAADEEHLAFLRELGLGSAILAPIVSHGEVLGVITFVSTNKGRRFGLADLERLEELGRRAGAAVATARLYEERTYIARTLQESLLPGRLPEIPGLEAAARFRATGAGNEVGGDFYDLFECAGGGWSVIVGDVCGKGPDAAAVTALARYTLRAAGMRERRPSESLRMLNEALLRQRSDLRFCTVAYALLEPNGAGADVSLASGGHPLPIALRANGKVERLGRPGTLLGVVPDPDLPDGSARLEPGDALVLYTDGVTDIRSTTVDPSPEWLEELLEGCAGMSADGIAGRIESAAVEAQDGETRDDIAVVVLRAST